MSDPELVWRSRFLAQDFFDSLVKIDLGKQSSQGYSLVNGVNNQDLEALTYIWQESFMKDNVMRTELLNHLNEHPDGFLKRAVEMIVSKWVQIKGYEVDKVLKDFSLLE